MPLPFNSARYPMPTISSSRVQPLVTPSSNLYTSARPVPFNPAEETCFSTGWSIDPKASGDALCRGKPRFGNLAKRGLRGLEHFRRRRFRRAAVEGRLGGIFDGELNLLCDTIIAQQRHHPQCSINSGRDAGGTYVLAVQHNASIDRNRSKVPKQIECRPMRSSLHATEQASRAT